MLVSVAASPQSGEKNPLQAPPIPTDLICLKLAIGIRYHADWTNIETFGTQPDFGRAIRDGVLVGSRI